LRKLIILFILLIFWSCQTPIGKQPEKETTIKEITKNDPSMTVVDKKFYPEDQPMVIKLKKLLPQGSLFAGQGNGWKDVPPGQVQTDKQKGKRYWENSFTVTSGIETFDLSSILGGNHKAYKIRVYCMITDYGLVENAPGKTGGIDTPAVIRFSTPGSNLAPQTLTQRYNDPYYNWIDVITNEAQEIDAQVDITAPYDEITDAANPGVHVYKWIEIELRVYAVGEEITFIN
jgi:hypothetical protein